MKIVYMGTPEFAVPALKALLRSGHQIAAVVSQPDRPKGRGRELQASPVKLCALEAGLDIYQPEKASAPDFVETLRGLRPDLIVVVAYGQILKTGVLEIPKHFCMNLHASVLPSYRGAAPINRAVINGDAESGVTTMKMDAGLDTGDILLVRRVPITDSDDSKTLHDVLSETGAGLVLETLERLESGSLTPVPQDAAKATYAPKLKKEDGLISWMAAAQTIRNQARGLVPWPGAYTFFKSRRIVIDKTEVTAGDAADKPGVIARVSDYGIEVGTGRDRLIVTELKPEGKKSMSAKSFLQGNALKKGDCFESEPASANPDAA